MYGQLAVAVSGAAIAGGVKASEATDTVSAFILDVGAVAAALTAIGALLWAAQKMWMKQIARIAADANKPITGRLDRLEERQLAMQAILVERRFARRFNDPPAPPLPPPPTVGKGSPSA